MVKFPPIRVLLCIQGDRRFYGVLVQREVVVDSIKTGQMWAKFDDDSGLEDIWIKDASIVSMQVINPKGCGLDGLLHMG